MNNLYHVAGWITLLDGIQRVDAMCTKRGVDFNKYMKPEELEKYVHARKEDVLFNLRDLAIQQGVTDKQLAKRLIKLPISQLVDTLNENAVTTKLH